MCQSAAGWEAPGDGWRVSTCIRIRTVSSGWPTNAASTLSMTERGRGGVSVSRRARRSACTVWTHPACSPATTSTATAGGSPRGRGTSPLIIRAAAAAAAPGRQCIMRQPPHLGTCSYRWGDAVRLGWVGCALFAAGHHAALACCLAALQRAGRRGSLAVLAASEE